MKTTNESGAPKQLPSLGVTFRDVHHWNEVISGSLSVTANAVLSLLIITETNFYIRRYAFILLINSNLDMLFAIISMLLEVQCELVDARLIVVQSGVIRHLPLRWRYMAQIVYGGFLCFVHIIPPVTFIFRYMLVVQNRQLPRKYVSALIGVLAGVSVHQGLMLALPLISNEAHHAEECARLLTDRMWHEPTEAVCMTSSRFNRMFIYSLVIVVVFTLMNYTIMICLSIAIRRHLKANTMTMSMRTRKLQSQLNRTLIFQMILLLLCELLPANAFCIFPLFGLDVPGIGPLLTMPFTWVPLINPATTMFMVAPFRIRLTRCLLRITAPGVVTPSIRIATMMPNEVIKVERFQ